MRGVQDRRQWVLIAKREVGRAEPHAIWTATDAVRGTARSAQSHIAFGCQIIGSAAQDAETGLIGVIGSERIAQRDCIAQSSPDNLAKTAGWRWRL